MGVADPPPLSVPALPPKLSLPQRWLESKQRKACVPTTLRRYEREVHLSTHMFRRSGATLLEETLLNSPQASRDGVYRTVQEFLRHENLATTMKYLESNPRRQRRALERYGQVFPWPNPC